MQKRPIALVAVLAGIALGLFFLWRGLGGDTGTALPASTSVEVRSERSEKSPTPSPLETAAAPEDEGARADAARSAAELATRTETFPLADAAWIQGTVRFPKESPADETLQAWAFEDSAARGLSRSEGDLPDRVRTGKLEKAWWSRRPIDASGTFRLPIPKGAGAASVLVDGRFLFLKKIGQVGQGHLQPLDATLVLEPELGAWLVGRCTLPATAKAEDAPTGEPVEFTVIDMSPSSEDQGSRSTLVGSDLAFELRGVPAHMTSWLSIAPKRLVAVFRSDIGLVPGKRCEIDIALTLGGRASGRVVDESGTGVAGARVELQPERGSYGSFGIMPQSDRGSTTAADGSFELFGIRPGKARISAKEDGYVDARTDVLAFADGDVRSDLSIALSRGNHVAGRVAWPDGSPAVGAAVQALGKISIDDMTRGRRRPYSLGQFLPKSGKTGEKGEFAIYGLGPGPFEVSVVAHRAVGDRTPGQENAAGENLPAWTVELAGVSANAEDLALVLREPVGLAGRVVDDQGAPVKKFAITASPAREDDGTGGLSVQIALKTTTFEAEDGSFFLNGLQPGKWKIAAEAKGFVQIDEPTVDVPRAEGTVVVALTRAASAAGTVVDPDGRPVAGAEVSQGNGESSRRYGLRVQEAAVKADAQGAFVIEGLPPGALQLVASSESFARSDPASLQLEAGRTLEGVVLHLHLGGNLTGEVFDAHGAHAVGRKVMVMSMGGGDRRDVTVDDAGQFAAEHLTPGAYQVIAEPTQAEQESMIAKGANGGEMDPSEIFATLKMASAQIKEGETAHVVLGAPPKAPVRLFGTVTRAGEALTSGTVMCIGEGGSLLSKLKMGKVRANGDYEIKLDEPGAVVLSYQRELSGVGAGEFHVTVPEATEFRLDLEVPTGGLRGVVRGPDGSPLAGISINLLRQGGLSSISSMDRGGSERSDANGRFEFGDLAAGTYGLAAGGGGEVSGDSKSVPWGRAVVSGLRVESNRFHEGVEIRLSKPGSITGLVRNSDGNPVTGATVFACDEHGEIVHRFSEVSTDARGSFTYRGLAPGRYVLCARTKTLASNESAAISVHEGEAAEVELTAGTGTTLVASVEFPGRIAQVLVDEGDTVIEGQVVARMDSQDVEAQLKKSQAQAKQAERSLEEARAVLDQQKTVVQFAQQEFDRTNSLLQRGFTTHEIYDQRRQTLDAANAVMTAAVARVGEAERALDAATHDVELYSVNIADNTLVAPRAGRIQYRIANVGEVLPAGGKVFTMLDLSDVYMDVYLPTVEAGRARIGDEARIVLDAFPDFATPAHVSFIATQAQFTPKAVETKSERDKLMFRVRVRADAAFLRGREPEIRTGLPGVGYVRLADSIVWPERLRSVASP